MPHRRTGGNRSNLPCVTLIVTRLLVLSAFSWALCAQSPRVGDVNFYGLRHIPAEKILSTLQLKPGDPLPPSKGDLEDRIAEIPGVVQARVEAVCCQDSKAVLFVGLEERGAPHFAFRSDPSGDAVLPESLVADYGRFLEAVQEAGRRGSIAEDLTEGHALMADPTARELQLRFAAFAAGNLKLVRDVLRDASEPEQRAMAATVAGYTVKKTVVIDDLQYAMQDPDEAVRATAMRSLSAIAVLAARRPALEIRIPATWFIEMLNSIVLSDRLKAAQALVLLTEGNAPTAVAQLRARALPALVEMARWKTLEYALPPFILLGRVVGLSELEIQERWSKGEREAVIDRALAPPRGKRAG